jgi:hypothetical protein
MNKDTYLKLEKYNNRNLQKKSYKQRFLRKQRKEKRKTKRTKIFSNASTNFGKPRCFPGLEFGRGKKLFWRRSAPRQTVKLNLRCRDIQENSPGLNDIRGSDTKQDGTHKTDRMILNNMTFGRMTLSQMAFSKTLSKVAFSRMKFIRMTNNRRITRQIDMAEWHSRMTWQNDMAEWHGRMTWIRMTYSQMTFTRTTVSKMAFSCKTSFKL